MKALVGNLKHMLEVANKNLNEYMTRDEVIDVLERLFDEVKDEVRISQIRKKT